jgi:hypothetical protein
MRRLGRLALWLGALALVVHVVVDQRRRADDQFVVGACRDWRRAIADGLRWHPRKVSVDDGGEIERAMTRPEMAWLWDASDWLARHPSEVPRIVPFLARPESVGLTEPDDVFVWGRRMRFYGHGYMTTDDLFTRAGRASWLLHQATGRRDEPPVRPGTNRLILADRMRSWRLWFEALDGGRACFGPH